MTPCLSFTEVACVRGGRVLFDRLSFRLRAGEAALVTGPNGAGKSSLIRVAAGLLAPAAGAVERVGGAALLNEAVALDEEARLADALAFWARLDGSADPFACVRRALDDGGLTDLADVPVRLLSTGQRRRAAMARVLAGGAEVWLLDEPGNGLDPDAIARLEALVARHRAGGGVVLLATHLPLGVPGALAIDLAPRA